MKESNVSDILIVTEEKSGLAAADVQNIETAAKWGKFLAIVQFVVLALAAIFLLIALIAVGAAGVSLPGMAPAAAGMMIWTLVFSLAIILIGFVPAFFLFRSSKSALAAVRGGSKGELSDAIFNVRRLAKFQGILTIVIIALYIVLVFVMAAVGASAIA